MWHARKTSPCAGSTQKNMFADRETGAHALPHRMASIFLSFGGMSDAKSLGESAVMSMPTSPDINFATRFAAFDEAM